MIQVDTTVLIQTGNRDSTPGQPGQEIGMVLQGRNHDMVAIAQRQPMGERIDRVRAIGGKDHFSGAASQKGGQLVARRRRQLGGQLSILMIGAPGIATGMQVKIS
ncbi:hypothetical protein C3E98_034315, partial [Pseudomonas sp. MWU13-2625]